MRTSTRPWSHLPSMTSSQQAAKRSKHHFLDYMGTAWESRDREHWQAELRAGRFSGQGNSGPALSGLVICDRRLKKIESLKSGQHLLACPRLKLLKSLAAADSHALLQLGGPRDG